MAGARPVDSLPGASLELAPHGSEGSTATVRECSGMTPDERWGAGGLRRVHGIAQMRDTHTGDDCRIPEDDRCVREMVEQPHSCA
jgi:hypothetical protein